MNENAFNTIAQMMFLIGGLLALFFLFMLKPSRLSGGILFSVMVISMNIGMLAKGIHLGQDAPWMLFVAYVLVPLGQLRLTSSFMTKLGDKVGFRVIAALYALANFSLIPISMFLV